MEGRGCCLLETSVSFSRAAGGGGGGEMPMQGFIPTVGFARTAGGRRRNQKKSGAARVSVTLMQLPVGVLRDYMG